MKKILVLILIYQLFLQQAVAHPHHYSLVVCSYNPTSQQLEMSIRMLTEDFDKINRDTGLEKYINKTLKLSMETKKLHSTYQGQEQQYEYTWLYLTIDVEIIKKAGTNSTLKVQDSILMHSNDNQFNTFKLSVYDKQVSHNFSASENTHTFVIDNIKMVSK
jgi:hypothetical protein